MFRNLPHFFDGRRSVAQRRKMVLRIPLKEELVTIRILVVLALVTLGFFLNWFFQPEHRGVSWLYWLLVFAMLYKLLRWLHEWYHYVNVSYPEPPSGERERQHWKVDMLTTFCAGESYDMVEETLAAMVAVKYPHTTYLCDEADDPRLRQFCRKLGVVHVTREKKVNANAGNINNALRQASGEIVVVLDPDHKPSPDFLDHVLPYFNDEKIGFVQVVQSYGNQNESFVAKGAAEQTYQFYGPLMMGMNSYGTAQAIGANCTFRRSALDSIGGHAAGLSEDMHTAMQLHAKGWKSVYLPMVLTVGLAPASLSAFFQQQLKWSRGTFELLVTSYLRLFRHFTLRQKLHYFTIALYFLSGLITLLDISIPVFALLTAQPVWKIDLSDFLIMFAPVFILSVLIRAYTQRWLPKKEERGFHLKGGILQLGTWWIYLTGLICTILRIKIPYIPTPKDNEARNDFKLSLPNLAAAAVSLGAIPIGLLLDWSPFSIFMAGFALVNAVLLIWVSVLAQQKLVKRIKASIAGVVTENNTRKRLRQFWNRLHESSLGVMRRWALVPGIAVFAFSVASEIKLELMEPTYRLEEIQPPVEKDCGGFYTGIYIPEVEKKNSFQNLDLTEKQLNTTFDLVSIYMAWGPESGAVFPDTLMKRITERKAIPVVTWEPWTWPFPEYKNHPDLCCEKKVLKYITGGYFDKYLTEYAKKFKAVDGPVMIRFAHEFDNPAYPWSEAGGNTPEDFIRAWRYVVNHFDSLGVGNVAWIWNPWEEEGLEKFYPGDDYVDWIGVTCLNYGKAASNNQWLDMDALYRPFSEKIKKYHKPVLLSEFGTTVYGGDQSIWFDRAFRLIETEFTEVRGLVFFYSDKDPHWGFTSWRPESGDSVINWTFSTDETRKAVSEYLNREPFNIHPLRVHRASCPPYS